MFITTENEIISLMPTARWNRPDQLKGWLEEEERVALEPLLGMPLYLHLCQEYERLRGIYADITATTIKPTGKAKSDPGVPYADVTERLDAIHDHGGPYVAPCPAVGDEQDDVPEDDMQAVRLIRICQQIEFYKMVSHKAGLLTVSFNEGGGMNVVTADGYDEAGDKRMERVVKDAFMSAGRAVDSLLLFLEADARGARRFTEMWSRADAFYLHRDLLFQTARVLNEYLDIRGERMAYVQLVRDIRFCQNTYLKPRIGAGLLKAVVEWGNGSLATEPSPAGDGSGDGLPADDTAAARRDEAFGELIVMLRTALAFYVEGRRTELGPKGERLARRDSMTDAQQAMAMACQYIEDNIDALGAAAVDTPIYNAIRAREEQAARDAENREKARCRRMASASDQSRRKLFTGFPATHRTPELK